MGTLGWALWGWALQRDSGVVHSRETLGLGTPGTLEKRRGEEFRARRRVVFKTNNPTPRVGNKGLLWVLVRAFGLLLFFAGLLWVRGSEITAFFVGARDLGFRGSGTYDPV